MTLVDYRPRQRLALAGDPNINAASGFWPTPLAFFGSTTAALATQTLRLNYFRAPATVSIPKIRNVVTVYTATGHTYSGVGVWKEETNGDLTLVGKYEETASPPTLFGSVAAFLSTLNQAVGFIADAMYAWAPLVVFTGGAIQTVGAFPGGNDANTRSDNNLGPGARRCVSVTGQSSIPSSISNATLAAATGHGFLYYARMAPS